MFINGRTVRALSTSDLKVTMSQEIMIYENQSDRGCYKPRADRAVRSRRRCLVVQQDLVCDSCTPSATESLAATEFPICDAPNLPYLPSLKRPQCLLLLHIGKAAPSLSVQTHQTLPKSFNAQRHEALPTISVRFTSQQ